MARLGLRQGVCPSLYEEEEVWTDSVCFYRGEIKALNGQTWVPRPLGCLRAWVCAQNTQRHTGWLCGQRLAQAQVSVCSAEEWVSDSSFFL